MVDNFVGKEYHQEKSENLNEYLSAKGVPWLVRKLISGRMDNGLFKLTKENDEFDIVLGSSKGNLNYRFKLGETFTSKGYDGKEHKITFSMNGDSFIEKHEHLEGDRKGEDNDVTTWKFEGDYLVSEAPATDKNGMVVVWKRYLKPIQ